MKRVVLVVFMALLLAGSLAAGGGQQSSGGGSRAKPSTVTFWDENPGPDRTPYLEQIIQWYNESQSAYRVEYVGVPSAQFTEKLNVAISGNAVPDISGMSFEWLGGLINRNAVLKLDTIFGSWNEGSRFDMASVNAIRLIDANEGIYILRKNFSCQGGEIW